MCSFRKLCKIFGMGSIRLKEGRVGIGRLSSLAGVVIMGSVSSRRCKFGLTRYNLEDMQLCIISKPENS